jgi:hypothetical protein
MAWLRSSPPSGTVVKKSEAEASRSARMRARSLPGTQDLAQSNLVPGASTVVDVGGMRRGVVEQRLTVHGLEPGLAGAHRVEEFAERAVDLLAEVDDDRAGVAGPR